MTQLIVISIQLILQIQQCLLFMNTTFHYYKSMNPNIPKSLNFSERINIPCQLYGKSSFCIKFMGYIVNKTNTNKSSKGWLTKLIK